MKNGVHSHKKQEYNTPHKKSVNGEDRFLKQNTSFLRKMTTDYKTIVRYISKELKKPTGWRNHVMYCYARNISMALKDKKEIIRFTLKVNRYCERPLSEVEIRALCNHAIDSYTETGRIYSFESQLEWIRNKTGISIFSINSRLLLPTSQIERDANIAESRKQSNKRIAEKRKKERQQRKEQRIYAVKEMSSNGLKITEIAEKTGLSRKTVSKYIRS